VDHGKCGRGNGYSENLWIVGRKISEININDMCLHFKRNACMLFCKTQ